MHRQILYLHLDFWRETHITYVILSADPPSTSFLHACECGRWPIKGMDAVPRKDRDFDWFISFFCVGRVGPDALKCVVSRCLILRSRGVRQSAHKFVSFATMASRIVPCLACSSNRSFVWLDLHLHVSRRAVVPSS